MSANPAAADFDDRPTVPVCAPIPDLTGIGVALTVVVGRRLARATGKADEREGGARAVAGGTIGREIGARAVEVKGRAEEREVGARANVEGKAEEREVGARAMEEGRADERDTGARVRVEDCAGAAGVDNVLDLGKIGLTITGGPMDPLTLRALVCGARFDMAAASAPNARWVPDLAEGPDPG